MPKLVTTEQAVLGTLITKHRKEAGLKQNELAEKMGINPSTWSKIEKGGVSLSAVQLRKLYKIFSISIDRLFEDIENILAALPEQGFTIAEDSRSRGVFTSAVAGAVIGVSIPIVGSVLYGIVNQLLSDQNGKDRKK